MSFPKLVAAELERARRLHPTPHHSPHEAAAVILEEYEEFWELVKEKPQYMVRRRLLAELTHVAAMCQRAAEDLGYVEAAESDARIEAGLRKLAK